MADHRQAMSSASATMNRRDLLCRTAAVGMALGAGAMASKSTARMRTKPKKTTRQPIFKSLKFGMIREDLSILDKFKLVQDLG